MTQKKYHRVYCDGCFDVCHFGHFNFARQASMLSDEVYVGVHNDETISKYKGPPVFPQNERILMIESCKWVTKAIPDAPYYVNVELLNQYGCDCGVHGDDINICNENGENVYTPVIEAGKLQTVPRTKSISTTNIIGRMLRLPKKYLPDDFDQSIMKDFTESNENLHSYIPTTHRIAQFSNREEPKPGDKVVYCNGTFDLLHPGLVSFLKKAKELGDYLVVGIHDDNVDQYGKMKPILTMEERILNILAIEYVDDIVMNAPYVITKDIINSIQPSIVVEGSTLPDAHQSVDPYKLPKDLGIYQKIESDFPNYTTKTIIKRILDNYAAYAKRNSVKEKSDII